MTEDKDPWDDFIYSFQVVWLVAPALFLVLFFVFLKLGWLL